MNGKLTQAAIGEPEIDDWWDEDDEEDLTVGYSLMKALAAEYQLVQIAPGVWWHSNTPEDPGAYWLPKAP
ncbi:hypothetical protein [Actinoplanes subtropicus]|uniref:hypothetical protein n=1 Tax=Actinoplanes subtropicus TaxID=543632 RepID=UPI000AEE8626|nr:hypothetical protein [Actinoplanes subtropicus]